MMPKLRPLRHKKGHTIAPVSLSTGLRPDKDGVLRFAKLADAAWHGRRSPRPHEEKLLDVVNRALYRPFAQTDADKRAVDGMWKDLVSLWSFDDSHLAAETIHRLFETIEFQAARDVDPNPGCYTPDKPPRTVAPRLLRL